MYNALHLDPIPIPLGTSYALDGGRTLWHYPPLDATAGDDAQTYRRQQLATLDLRGHLVCDGDMTALAALLAEEQAL